MNTAPRFPGSDVPEDEIRGYEYINPAFSDAGLTLLSKLLCEKLPIGDFLDVDSMMRISPDGRYIQAALDFLYIHGYLDKLADGEYFWTNKGMQYKAQAPLVAARLETYSMIMRALKDEIGMANGLKGYDLEGKGDALMPAAATFAHEGVLLDGRKVGDLLAKGELIYSKDLGDHPNSVILMNKLLEASVLAFDDSGYRITPRGKKLIALGGYAELVLSYYDPLQFLYELAMREDSYGINGNRNRDPELNANASNGILHVRVAPYLVGALENNEILRNAIGDNGYFIDYGSGGGDMLIQAAKNGPGTISHLFGIDINSRANYQAEKNLELENFGDRASLLTGSIVDEDVLKDLSNRIQLGGYKGGVATINFIAHDIGPELTVEFLQLHARIFPDVPLIITETFKMSVEVCRAHPNYQASSFQFMHDISNQHLYERAELIGLLNANGFEVFWEQVHSTMPGLGDDEKLPTIVTLITGRRGLAA